MQMKLPIVMTLALLNAAVSGCAKRIDPDVLWLPADATIEVNAISMKAARGTYRDGSAEVVFTVAAPDPEDREKLTKQLAKHFAQGGWHPSRTQWLNPSLTSSLMVGWTHVCGCILPTDAEGRTLPSHETYTWHGEWENQDGDVVKYSLTATDGSVRGYAQYSPARAIKQG